MRVFKIILSLSVITIVGGLSSCSRTAEVLVFDGDAALLENPPAAIDTTELVDTLDPVDPACTLPGGTVFYPEFTPIMPPNYSGVSCLRGFDMNNFLKDSSGGGIYNIHSSLPSGRPESMNLEIDYGTYAAPDHLTITAITGDGSRVLLMDSCLMKTWTGVDPTKFVNENSTLIEPYDVAVRQFLVKLPANVVQLEVDMHTVETPTFLRIIGLCDFVLEKKFSPFPLLDDTKWRYFEGEFPAYPIFSN